MNLNQIPRGTLNVVTAGTLMFVIYVASSWLEMNTTRWEAATKQLESIDLNIQKLALDIQQLRNTTVTTTKYQADKDLILSRANRIHEELHQDVDDNTTEIKLIKQHLGL